MQVTRKSEEGLKMIIPTQLLCKKSAEVEASKMETTCILI
jgi:hypothetical protein